MVRELLCVGLLAAALAVRAGAEPALPETQLPLRLIGTVVAAQAERSIAVIESLGTTQVVRTGDAIGAARVQEIHKDGVVLAQAGRLERLALASVASRAPAGSGASSASDPSFGEGPADARDATDRGSREAAPQRARTASRSRATRRTAVPASAARGQDGEAGSSATEQVTSDQLLVNLSGQARYAPLLGDDGQLRGVAVLDVKPDSTLERIGLRSGDVIVSVAGVQVDNSPAALDALRALNPKAGGEVMVERGGVPTRIVVPPGAL
jgi:type II secretion system protein C